MLPKWSLRHPGAKCAVPHCKNRIGVSPNLSFHKFPSNHDLVEKWCWNINIVSPDENKLKKLRLCDIHFDKTSKKLSLPVFFLSPEQTVVESPGVTEDIVYSFPEGLGSTVEIDESTSEHELTIPSDDTRFENDITSSDVMREHNYFIRNIEERLKSCDNRIWELEQKIDNLKTRKFNIYVDSIVRDQCLLNFYTGFADIGKFECFVHICSDLKKMFDQQNKNIKFLEIDIKEQIFIFLISLRLGLLENDIAVRHGISQSYVSSIVNFYLDLVYLYFKRIPIWPTKETVRKYIPQEFSKRYPSTRVILDATEILIQKPSDYIVQSSTYSSYKSANTAKGLIGITPNGLISFISDIYPGRMSGKEIFNKSGIALLLEPGDAVMADRGFDCAGELALRDVDLHMPPFLHSSQFSPSQVQETRDIANLRIHIERMFGSIKNYRILKPGIPNKMAKNLHKLWLVCSMLPNFNNYPLLNRITNKK